MSDLSLPERLLGETTRIRLVRWLVKQKARNGLKSPHLWGIAALLAVLTFCLYFILPGFRDLYILLFFYPLAYASIVYRMRGALVTGGILVIILVSLALIDPDAAPLTTLLLFAFFILQLNMLGATLLNYLETEIESYEEIVRLNTELSDSLKEIENTQRQLFQSEKMSTIGELAASIAHEINNPLAGILIYVKLFAKRVEEGNLDKADTLENLAKIETGIKHVATIIRGLLDFSRPTQPIFTPVSVNTIIDQTLVLVAHQAERAGVRIVRGEAEVPEVMADPGQVQQVFTNLIVNAVQAMENGGQLTIAPRRTDGFVRVDFTDTGPGIAPENMNKLFTPFFSTKESGKGVGLGLAVSRAIIEKHGGRIEVRSEPGKGTTFSVFLPCEG